MVRLRARDGRDPRELAALDIDVHLDNQTLKAKYVRVLFDTIAPGYDSFTRLFSFGMDQTWKTLLIREGASRISECPLILDLACGTGDLGIQLARRTASGLVIGLDVSPRMLEEAKARRDSNITLVACDILHLCLHEQSVDVVTIGYGLRNTSDAARALQEIARVLRPHGILLSLDFYRPIGKLWRKMLLWYIWNAGRLAGWLWHRQPIAYGYLAPSIDRYMTMPQFEAALSLAGFKLEWQESRLGGGIGLHVARRDGLAGAGSPASV